MGRSFGHIDLYQYLYMVGWFMVDSSVYSSTHAIEAVVSCL